MGNWNGEKRPEGKCRNCDYVGPLTRDHIIPKWFASRVHNLGLDFPFLKQLRMVNGKECLFQLLCPACNHKKGGVLDYTHPQTRAFMAELTVAINDKLKATEHEELQEKVS